MRGVRVWQIPRPPLPLLLQRRRPRAATAISTAKSDATPPPAAGAADIAPREPQFFRDIFLEPGVAGSLDLPRTQMFLWTLISVVTYVTLFVAGFPRFDDKPNTLLEVPVGMLALMGLSQGAPCAEFAVQFE